MTGPPHPFDAFRLPLLASFPPPECFAPDDTLLDSESMLAWGVNSTRLGDKQIISLAKDIIKKAQGQLGIEEIRNSLHLWEHIYNKASPELTNEEQNELTRRYDDAQHDLENHGIDHGVCIYNSLVARMRLFILVAEHRERRSESVSMHIDDVNKFEAILNTWLDLFSRIEQPFTVDADVRIGLQDVLRETEDMAQLIRVIQENIVGELR